MADLAELIEKVKRCRKSSNDLDMEIDLALFEPDGLHTSVRPNDAGTKLVYTRTGGETSTFLANDWTLCKESRRLAVKRLTAKQEASNG